MTRVGVSSTDLLYPSHQLKPNGQRTQSPDKTLLSAPTGRLVTKLTCSRLQCAGTTWDFGLLWLLSIDRSHHQIVVLATLTKILR